MLRAAMAVHTPLERAPTLSGDRMLVVSAEGDRIAPPEHAERLARHFDADELRFAGGHVFQVGRSEAFRAIVRRLAEFRAAAAALSRFAGITGWRPAGDLGTGPA